MEGQFFNWTDMSVDERNKATEVTSNTVRMVMDIKQSQLHTYHNFIYFHSSLTITYSPWISVMTPHTKVKTLRDILLRTSCVCVCVYTVYSISLAPWRSDRETVLVFTIVSSKKERKCEKTTINTIPKALHSAEKLPG